MPVWVSNVRCAGGSAPTRRAESQCAAWPVVPSFDAAEGRRLLSWAIRHRAGVTRGVGRAVASTSWTSARCRGSKDIG